MDKRASMFGNSLMGWYLRLVDDGFGPGNMLSLDGGQTFYELNFRGYGGGPTYLLPQYDLKVHFEVVKDSKPLQFTLRLLDCPASSEYISQVNARPLFVLIADFFDFLPTTFVPLPEAWCVTQSYTYNNHYFIVVEDKYAYQSKTRIYYGQNIESIRFVGEIAFTDRTIEIPELNGVFSTWGHFAGVALTRVVLSQEISEKIVKLI